LNEKGIEMQKLNQKLEYARDLVAFLQQGGRVTVVDAAKPRKEELTFTMKNFIYNMPDRRGDSRRRSYTSTNDRRL
jgi:hypothetical protein